MAPALAGSPRVNGHRDYIIKVVLHGLDGSRRRQDLHGHDDSDGQPTTTSGLPRWARSCATTSATAAGSSRRRMSRACAPRPPAAQPLLDASRAAASMPAPLFTDGWKLTASHNADAADRRADGSPAWNAGAPQQAGHVVPGGAARSRRWSPRSSSSRRRQAGAAARGMPPPSPRAARRLPAPGGFPRGFKVEVSQDGSAWTRGVRGNRHRPDDHQHVPAGSGEVRSDQPDVERRGRARVVRPESQNLRPHEA